MKTFALYHHPQKGYEAVKQGFSWPGFLFTWIWAFVKKLPVIGVVLLLVLIPLRVLMETREPALVALGAIGILVVVFVVGFGGNQWRENKLPDRGYQLAEILQAENPEAAIARMIQREAVSRNSPGEAGHFCEHCGKPTSDSASFCQFCGKAKALAQRSVEVTLR
jgi:hypothetical protein